MHVAIVFQYLSRDAFLGVQINRESQIKELKHLEILSNCKDVTRVCKEGLEESAALKTNEAKCVQKLFSITLVNDQLDAQFFYLIIRFLQSSTCFEQSRAHHQEVRLY